MVKPFVPAVLAQPVERMAFNHVVVGSIPTDGVQFDFFFTTSVPKKIAFLAPSLCPTKIVFVAIWDPAN